MGGKRRVRRFPLQSRGKHTRAQKDGCQGCCRSQKGLMGAGVRGPSIHSWRQITEAQGTPSMTPGQVHTDFPLFTPSPPPTALGCVDNMGFVGKQRLPASLLSYFLFSSSWTDSQWSNAVLSGEAGWPRSDKGPIPTDVSFHRRAATASTWE